MTTVKIDRLQYFFMIPNLLFGKAIGITAGVIVRKIGADVWLSMTIGFFFGIIIMLLTTFLCSRFPGKTIIEFCEELLGKWTGKICGTVLLFYFVIAFATSANVMALHLNEYFLPETPFIVICLLYTLLCMYGVFLGIEVVLRFSLVGFIMIFLINIAMITGTIQDVRPINLLPLADKGLANDITASIYLFGDISFSILSAGFIYPMLNKKKKSFRLTFWSMITAMVLIIVWPIFEVMVMGPELMKQYVIVCMQQIRNAQLTRYLPRYELIMVSFFSFGMLVQSAVLFYCAKHCIKQVTKIKKDILILIPLAIVLCGVTNYLGQDHNRYIDFLTFPYPQICAALSIGLPALLAVVALLRGKLKKTQESNKNS